MSKEENQAKLFHSLANGDEEYQAYLDRISDRKKARVQQSVGRMTTGLHATAPVMCNGPDKCIFINHCPIPERTMSGLQYGPDSDYPMYQPCILEKLYMEQKMIDYCQHLDVDPSDPFEMAIVNELSLVDLLKNRAMMIVSAGDKDGEGQDMMKTDITGFNPETGQQSSTTKLHPLTDFIEKLEKRRQYWSNQLLETRKARFDVNMKMGLQKEESKLLKELSGMRGLLQDLAEGRQELSVLEDTVIKIDD